MGTIALDYSQMSQTVWAAQRAASKCDDYIGEINRKVTQKLNSLERGQNGLVGSANYFAQQKIADLDRKREQFEQYGHRMAEVMQYAKDTDNRVSSYIKTESREFRRNHGMEVSIVVELFTWLSTTTLNRSEFGRFLNQMMRDIGNWVDIGRRRFKQLYRLEGGKYILKVILNIALTAAAMLILVLVALPALISAIATIAAGFTLGALWTLIAAGAAFTTAFITILDCATKAAGNMAAAETFKDDPGWAQRYGSYGSFAEYLRKTNFHDGYSNKLSYIYANRIDTVTFVAKMINMADTAFHGINFYKAIKKNGINHYLKKIHIKTKDGKVSWATFKYGMKTARENIKTLKYEVNNTNVSRLTEYFKSRGNIKIVYKFKSGVKDIEKLMDVGVRKYLEDKLGKKVRDNVIGLETIKTLKDNFDSGSKLYNTYQNTRYGYF